MKRILVMLLLSLFVFSGTACAENKALVAYFSWGGNTEAVAKNIADLTGFEIFKITPAKPYTTNYDAVLDVAKKEQNKNARPELAEHKNITQYDTIFLGYPCWWGNMPMAVFTFLEENNFSGKRVIPFVTHGGSSFGSSLNAMKRTIPNAKIENNGLSISGSSASNSRSQVSKWLQGLGFEVKK